MSAQRSDMTAAPAPEGPSPVGEQSEGLAALTRSLRVGLVWLYAVVALMIVTVLAQSFLIVKQHEVAFVYRFGRLRGIMGTGLHLVWPYPVEQARTFDLSRSKELESRSFLADEASAARGGAASGPLRPGVEGFLLTGDLNIIHAGCTLTYRVDAQNADALRDYFMTAVDREALLRALLDNATLRAAVAMPAEDVLLDPDAFRTGVAGALRENMRRTPMGVSFESRDVTVTAEPPKQARAAFDALSQASQEQDRMKSEALAYSIKTEREAQSRAEGTIAQAEAERVARLAAAGAAAATFKQRLAQYEKTPELVAATIYEETLARILAHVDEKFVVRRRPGRQIRMMLGRDPGASGTTGSGND